MEQGREEELPQSVAAIVFDGHSRILCVWNDRYLGWTLPGGLMEPTDASRGEALQREVREETGLIVVEAHLVAERRHDKKPDNNPRARSSRLSLFRARVQGAVKAMEDNRPVMWMPVEQYLKVAPFADLYGEILWKERDVHAAMVGRTREELGLGEEQPERAGHVGGRTEVFPVEPGLARMQRSVGKLGDRARVHDLKTWPEEFHRTWNGEKRHDARKNDRAFVLGDLLLLREYDPSPGDRLFELRKQLEGADVTPGHYTGRAILAFVTYIAHGGRFGIEPGHCVMSIEVVETIEEYAPGVFNQSIVAYGGVL
jgi:ADP-ribose pyrophosphatase YjhB (NUDIX family)